MKATIITSKQLASCPQHIMTAEHLMPEHHTEECDPTLKRRLNRHIDELKQQQQREIVEVQETYKRQLEHFRALLRKETQR